MHFTFSLAKNRRVLRYPSSWVASGPSFLFPPKLSFRGQLTAFAHVSVTVWGMISPTSGVSTCLKPPQKLTPEVFREAREAISLRRRHIKGFAGATRRRALAAGLMGSATPRLL